MIDKTKLQEIYDKGTTLSDVNYPSPKDNGLVTASRTNGLHLRHLTPIDIAIQSSVTS